MRDVQTGIHITQARITGFGAAVYVLGAKESATTPSVAALPGGAAASLSGRF